MKYVDITGKTFGQWTVLNTSGLSGKNYLIRCRCSCGTIKDVFKGNVVSGKSVSCGCKRNEETRKRETVHGMSKTLTYKTWASMINRCTNSNESCFKFYGGRGIRVCERWMDFVNFYNDMGEKPNGFSLDRIDPNGNYELNNCRWVSIKVQQRNKRNTVRAFFNGTSKSVAEWCEAFGIPYKLIISRMKKWNCSFDEAASRPVRKYLSRKSFTPIQDWSTPQVICPSSAESLRKQSVITSGKW